MGQLKYMQKFFFLNCEQFPVVICWQLSKKFIHHPVKSLKTCPCNCYLRFYYWFYRVSFYITKLLIDLTKIFKSVKFLQLPPNIQNYSSDVFTRIFDFVMRKIYLYCLIVSRYIILTKLSGQH